jgi:hypothetical protein
MSMNATFFSIYQLYPILMRMTNGKEPASCETDFGVYRSPQLTPHPFFLLLHLFTDHTLVDRFPLPPVASPIRDTSLTHVMRLAAHSTTSPTPTAMGQPFIMTLYLHQTS